MKKDLCEDKVYQNWNTGVPSNYSVTKDNAILGASNNGTTRGFFLHTNTGVLVTIQNLTAIYRKPVMSQLTIFLFTIQKNGPQEVHRIEADFIL